MQLLEDRILQEGVVLPGGVLKVGSFLNQKIDQRLLRDMALEVERLYQGLDINKVLTIESSGIAIASAVAMEMDVPMVFAKKHKTSNVDGDVLTAMVHSFTHGTDYQIVVSSDYLTSDDRVLLVDDFLAMGNSLKGLAKLVDEANATLIGAAVSVEKCFQGGGDELRANGMRVEALAGIASMENDGTITFRH
ncbi:MAG: xanthine phosphoribosyltransferase [Olegusella sp.]|nr:xanthine phosphoribosyltransferase [Olegusella sp.]